MPFTFSMTSALITLGLIAAIVLGVIGFGQYQYSKGFEAGKQTVVATQAKAQVKHTKRVREVYDEIDHNAPSITDRDAVVKFLLNHTRSDSK